MVIERYPPTDPREWLRFAQDNLFAARTWSHPSLEIPAFHAQQAAEMAIKAVFIVQSLVFPYSHNLAELLKQLDNAGLDVPASVRAASQLTVFASITRYPNFGAPVTKNQYEAAVTIAGAVLAWADDIVQPRFADDTT